MTFRIFAGAVLAPMLTLACSGGDDVVVTPSPSPTSSASSASSCKVSPDENICGRTFDLPESDRGSVVSFLQITAIFAGQAHEMSVAAFAACDAMGDELGTHGVGLPEDSPTKKKLSGCAAVAKAIAALGPSALAISLGKPACSVSELPSCASTSSYHPEPLQRCNPPSITVTVDSSASTDVARANVIAESLRRHLPKLAAMKSRLEALAELSAAVSGHVGQVGALADQRSSACALSAAAMVTTALDDVKAAADANTSVLATLDAK